MAGEVALTAYKTAPRVPFRPVARTPRLTKPGPEAAPPIVQEALRSPGQLLDAATRTFMEPRFGHDFGAIVVHADQQASLAAATVGARAYTVGRHIVMGGGQYQPASLSGRWLLAHELTHAIQQDESTREPAGLLTIADPDTSAEQEADRTAGTITGMASAGKPLEISRRTASVQRKCIEDGNGVSHWKYEYDGCSLPAHSLSLGGLTLGGAAKDNPAGGDNTAFALMRPTTEGGLACDRHDECYQSCTTTKHQCDDRMYADMKEVCAKSSLPVREKCYSAAWLYYQGLKQLPQAQQAFDDRKNDVCSCDPGSRPPAERFPPLELLRSVRGGYLSWLDYQLSMAKLTGYRAFRDQAQYESYLHGDGGGDGNPARVP